ncbi:hypothetical protein CAOG_03191 [Capsaspora owczarzaki ATCC 30864]|uniref:Uncharacterized protein n=1 Tax=Capsaspora owczarzaki (strain ATCC 30864) TaxID=595528 RepID=A0A0D2WMQ1_CAPO3|nr:hypothetical protein CAOG_03191 [Capsaspora owczarzaki ATCC 30864]KJE92175.1 hypothetical protein CAOG_003191 [Capsaspora owczarzaki ATCC 30864]|eukprot:XP_004364030.1 hypothetical protein CAOG_03191 [Capsaspora owczarzaki ATCC 30864]
MSHVHDQQQQHAASIDGCIHEGSTSGGGTLQQPAAGLGRRSSQRRLHKQKQHASDEAAAPEHASYALGGGAGGAGGAGAGMHSGSEVLDVDHQSEQNDLGGFPPAAAATASAKPLQMQQSAVLTRRRSNNNALHAAATSTPGAPVAAAAAAAAVAVADDAAFVCQSPAAHPSATASTEPAAARAGLSSVPVDLPVTAGAVAESSAAAARSPFQAQAGAPNMVGDTLLIGTSSEHAERGRVAGTGRPSSALTEHTHPAAVAGTHERAQGSQTATSTSATALNDAALLLVHSDAVHDSQLPEVVGQGQAQAALPKQGPTAPLSSSSLSSSSSALRTAAVAVAAAPNAAVSGSASKSPNLEAANPGASTSSLSTTTPTTTTANSSPPSAASSAAMLTALSTAIATTRPSRSPPPLPSSTTTNNTNNNARRGHARQPPSHTASVPSYAPGSGHVTRPIRSTSGNSLLSPATQPQVPAMPLYWGAMGPSPSTSPSSSELHHRNRATSSNTNWPLYGVGVGPPIGRTVSDVTVAVSTERQPSPFVGGGGEMPFEGVMSDCGPNASSPLTPPNSSSSSLSSTSSLISPPTHGSGLPGAGGGNGGGSGSNSGSSSPMMRSPRASITSHLSLCPTNSTGSTGSLSSMSSLDNNSSASSLVRVLGRLFTMCAQLVDDRAMQRPAPVCAALLATAATTPASTTSLLALPNATRAAWMNKGSAPITPNSTLPSPSSLDVSVGNGASPNCDPTSAASFFAATPTNVADGARSAERPSSFELCAVCDPVQNPTNSHPSAVCLRYNIFSGLSPDNTTVLAVRLANLIASSLLVRLAPNSLVDAATLDGISTVICDQQAQRAKRLSMNSLGGSIASLENQSGITTAVDSTGGALRSPRLSADQAFGPNPLLPPPQSSVSEPDVIAKPATPSFDAANDDSDDDDGIQIDDESDDDSYGDGVIVDDDEDDA